MAKIFITSLIAVALFTVPVLSFARDANRDALWSIRKSTKLESSFVSQKKDAKGDVISKSFVQEPTSFKGLYKSGR